MGGRRDSGATAGVSMSTNSQDMQHKREKGRRGDDGGEGREERDEREGEAKCVFDLKMLKQMSIWRVERGVRSTA